MSRAAENSPVYDQPAYSGLIGLADVAAALWRRKLLIFLVTLLCAGLPYASSFLMPNYYFIYTQILLDPDGQRIFATDLQKPEQQRSVDWYVVSQQGVIASDLVLGQVVESEKLYDDPDFGAASPYYPDKARKTQLAVEKLRDAVKLKRIGDSYIIEVKVTDTQPERAMRIANRIPDIYFKERQQSSADVFRRTGNSLAEQLQSLKAAVEAADRAVNDYRAKNNIALIDGQSDIAGQVTELNNQISDLAGQIAEQQAIAAELDKARKNPDYRPSIPDTSLSQAIVQLRTRYEQSRAELNALAASVGRRHPDYQQAQERSRAIAEILDGELRNHANAAVQNVRTLRNQNTLLSAQLDKLKGQLNENDTTMVTLRELERTLASNRAVYEEFLLRTRQLSEQAGSAQEQPRVIDAAAYPLRRAGPPHNTIAFVGGLSGFILMMAGVLLRADLLSVSARKGLAA
ncbi:GumC family protein [Agrobacterium sp. BA1120]|uniref:GumC family protein n=1 Tax=Agrobacterium sp. BA1120 TaxID=3228927 RepID=UPI00336ABB1F